MSPYQAYNQFDTTIVGEIEDITIKNCPDPSITAIKIKIRDHLKGDTEDSLLVSISKYYTWIDAYNTDYSIEKGRKILAFIDEGRRNISDYYTLL